MSSLSHIPEQSNDISERHCHPINTREPLIFVNFANIDEVTVCRPTFYHQTKCDQFLNVTQLKHVAQVVMNSQHGFLLAIACLFTVVSNEQSLTDWDGVSMVEWHEFRHESEMIGPLHCQIAASCKIYQLLCLLLRRSDVNESTMQCFFSVATPGNSCSCVCGAQSLSTDFCLGLQSHRCV